jgi:hypothetical protein
MVAAPYENDQNYVNTHRSYNDTIVTVHATLELLLRLYRAAKISYHGHGLLRQQSFIQLFSKSRFFHVDFFN